MNKTPKELAEFIEHKLQEIGFALFSYPDGSGEKIAKEIIDFMGCKND